MNQGSSPYYNFRSIIWITILVGVIGFFFWFFTAFKNKTPSYAEYDVLFPRYNHLKSQIDHVILNETSYIATRKKLALIQLPPETLYFKVEHGDKPADILFNDNNYVLFFSHTKNGYGYGGLKKEGEIIKTVNISDTVTRDDISYSVFFSIPSI